METSSTLVLVSAPSVCPCRLSRLLKLLTLVTAFVRQKYKTYIFYGVIICDKHSSIINIKEGISVSHEAIKNGKIF